MATSRLVCMLHVINLSLVPDILAFRPDWQTGAPVISGLDAGPVVHTHANHCSSISFAGLAARAWSPLDGARLPRYTQFMHALRWTGPAYYGVIDCSPTFISCPIGSVVPERQIVDGSGSLGAESGVLECRGCSRGPTRVHDSLSLLLSIQACLRPACRTSLPCTARCNTPKPGHYEGVSNPITFPVGIPIDHNSRAAPDNSLTRLTVEH